MIQFAQQGLTLFLGGAAFGDVLDDTDQLAGAPGGVGDQDPRRQTPDLAAVVGASDAAFDAEAAGLQHAVDHRFAHRLAILGDHEVDQPFGASGLDHGHRPADDGLDARAELHGVVGDVPFEIAELGRRQGQFHAAGLVVDAFPGGGEDGVAAQGLLGETGQLAQHPPLGAAGIGQGSRVVHPQHPGRLAGRAGQGNGGEEDDFGADALKARIGGRVADEDRVAVRGRDPGQGRLAGRVLGRSADAGDGPRAFGFVDA